MSFIETLKDGQRRIKEVLELAEQLPPLQPADLERLKATKIALEIAVNLEVLKQKLVKELDQR